MVKEITKKQTIYLLLICLFGTKFQRLPSFLADISGKGFWVVLFIYMLIDGLFLMLAFKIINLGNGATLYQMIEKSAGKIIAKVILSLLGIYFFILAVLPYESVQEVFADVIFDSLPWKFFAFFLLISMGVLAVSGLRNIGRICQFFFYLVMIGVVGLFILGAITTDISRVLPFADIVISSVGDGLCKSSLWFGNFTILFVLMGKIENQKDKRFGGIYLSFFLGSLFVAVTYVVFYGIYGFITPLKRNLLTKISQFALLSLDIGRPDWFLILFAEIATILTAGIFVYCCAYCIREVIGCKKINYIIYLVLILLYIFTNFAIRSKLDIFKIYISYGSIFGMIIQYILPIILLLIGLRYRKLTYGNNLNKFKNHSRKRKVEAKS